MAKDKQRNQGAVPKAAPPPIKQEADEPVPTNRMVTHRMVRVRALVPALMVGLQRKKGDVFEVEESFVPTLINRQMVDPVHEE